ncbi:unnamed protein product [Absidia cylindrospora]
MVFLLKGVNLGNNKTNPTPNNTRNLPNRHERVRLTFVHQSLWNQAWPQGSLEEHIASFFEAQRPRMAVGTVG